MKISCGEFGCGDRAGGRPREGIGVLLAQLGTPDAPDAPSLRRYLKEFLGDPRVIEANRAVWWFVLNGIILRSRPKRSARLYKRIWTDEGSPLLITTERQTALLAERLEKRVPGIRVEFGMRYGNPSLESACDRLLAAGCRRIVLFPLYPQYSASTTGSTCDAVFARLLKERFVPALRVVAPYFDHPAFLKAWAHRIHESYRAMADRPERLILSFHGVPEKYVDKGDPYCCQCTETAEQLRPLLTVPSGEIIQTFQSRFGKDPWLQPYTDETLSRLAGEGVKKVAVACPGFVTDCLETIDEIGHEAHEQFRGEGGEWVKLIPCLNDDPVWMNAMEEIVWEDLESWVTPLAKRADNPVRRCPSKCHTSGCEAETGQAFSVRASSG